MTSSWAAGSVTVTALEDGAGTFFQPRQQAFPHATEADWRAADRLDPASASAAGEWLLRFRCFAIQLDGGRVTLVDAGIGPADSSASWLPVPGRLPAELTAAGIAPEDVTTVILTHLHADHVGWAVTDATPHFRNARYVLQRAEYEAVAVRNPGLRERLIAPLQATDQLVLVDGETTLADPLRVIATPGHTPGHQSVLLETGGDTLLVSGDLLVHAVQLVNPDLEYAFEADPETARSSRTLLLDQLATRGGRLATAHLTEPFLAVTPSGSAPDPPR